jgi:hypothetical protein
VEPTIDLSETGTIWLNDDVEAVYDEYLRRGWTDGLPIIPPTPERVNRMLAGAGLDADDVIAVLPPRRAPATVRAIAVNAVMAGCLPQYLPVLVAIVQAIAEDEFELLSVNTTTNTVGVLPVINGPIRSRINLNCGYGVFGPGWRANATIGRAVRLVQLNIAGAVPVGMTQSTQGQPGRYSMCIGELEEDSPWEPLHVQMGFAADKSTVSVFQATGTVPLTEVFTKSGRDLVKVFAHSMLIPGTTTFRQKGDSLLVLNPVHARLIAQAGYSKSSLSEHLFELTSRVPLDWFSPEWAERQLGRGEARDGFTQLHDRPSNFKVVVAGGAGGYHSTWIPVFGTSTAITREIIGLGGERA